MLRLLMLFLLSSCALLSDREFEKVVPNKKLIGAVFKIYYDGNDVTDNCYVSFKDGDDETHTLLNKDGLAITNIRSKRTKLYKVVCRLSYGFNYPFYYFKSKGLAIQKNSYLGEFKIELLKGNDYEDSKFFKHSFHMHDWNQNDILGRVRIKNNLKGIKEIIKKYQRLNSIKLEEVKIHPRIENAL